MINALITRPAMSDPGGVTVYLDSVTQHFTKHSIDIDFLEIGSTRGRFLHPVADQLAFRNKVRSHTYDIVHLNPSLIGKSFVRDGLLARQAKARGLPLLVFFHGWSEAFAQQVDKRWLRFFQSTFGMADGFIVLASDFEQKLKQWGVQAPVYRETTAVGNDLIADFDLEAKLARSRIEERCRILFLARLEPAKGVYETIDACTLLTQRNVSIELVIAGDGPEAGKMKAYAKEKLGDRVEFPGYVRGTSKIAAFTDAHLYAMPTAYAEGLPISLLEAMAFGLPVITRPVGGLKDIFIDGEHGFMTASKSPELIATHIEKMIAEPELWRGMSRNVHAYVKEQFVGSAVADKLAQIYRSVVGTNNT